MPSTTHTICARAGDGERLSDEQALALSGEHALESLLHAARMRRDRAHGAVVSYSPKVFIPLTHLCRDVCRYCTFAHTPRPGEPVYLSIEQCVAIARAASATYSAAVSAATVAIVKYSNVHTYRA